jgi:hypothetical protein
LGEATGNARDLHDRLTSPRSHPSHP